MVKNTHGGNKNKNQGRKFITKVSHKLRIAENDGELYGIVTKMLGNGMFYVHCIDNILRLGHIRGKFSGRGKRDNLIEINKWVLVGEREWDKPADTATTAKKLTKCDLLEIYSDLDKTKLMDSVSEDWSIIISQNTSGCKNSTDTVDIEFSTERGDEINRLLNEIQNNTTTAIELVITDAKDQNDWIDDI